MLTGEEMGKDLDTQIRTRQSAYQLRPAPAPSPVWKVVSSLSTSAPFLCLQADDEMIPQRVWHGRGAKLAAAAVPRCADNCLKGGPQPRREHRARMC